MRFKPDEIRRFSVQVFENLGVPPKNSHIIADSLIAANLRGVDSHGIARLGIYAKRLKAGVVKPDPKIEILQENNATILLDGDDGMGHVVGYQAMKLGIEKAKKNGAVYVGVKKSTHFGIGAYFIKQGISEDMITFAMSNAPSTMAPWGGIKPYFGTNPYAFGIPAGKNKPIILDMATSVVARGKIILAAQKGEKIPTGWAIDRDGQTTTDAKMALDGSVLPFGGPKGYAISLMIDVMSGVLTGAGFGPYVNNIYGDFDKPQNVGHFFQIIDINSFMPCQEFKSRVDQMIDDIKSSPKAVGTDEIFLPGEIEWINEQEHLEHGVHLDNEVYNDIKEVGLECGVDIKDYIGVY